MSRMLAAKAALSCRIDALGDEAQLEVGIEQRARLEQRIAQLQGQSIQKISGTGMAKAKMEKHQFKK